MGFNVGGIYVRASKGVDQGAVERAIDAHWTACGARRSTGELLARKPLALAETGALSFAIFPPKADDTGAAQWIAVADSERYRADPELAASLAKVLETEVWLYQVTDAADDAFARRFGRAPKVVRKAAEVEKLVLSMPHPHFYFDDLAKQSAAKRKGIAILGFESVPHRAKAEYSGPSAKELAAQRAGAEARARFAPAFAKRDVKALRALGSRDALQGPVLDAVQSLDVSDERSARFVCALAADFMSRPYSKSFWTFLEAAARLGDERVIKTALARIEDETEAGWGERHALALVERGDHAGAFLFLEAMTRAPVTTTTTWNNAVHLLASLPEVRLPEARIEALLRGARKTGPGNPAVLHNLACAYVSRRRLGEALECVQDAVKFGYEGALRMRDDADLAPLRKDARFAAAFAVKTPTTPAHLVITRKVSDEKGAVRLVAPAIGVHLYFDSGRAAPAIGALVGKLAEQFPKMFAFCAPQDGLDPRAVAKGRVARDISALTKNKPTYGFELHYDREGAHACDERLIVDLDKRRGGELSLYLPLGLADDPDALCERVLEYARSLPFASGSAGYALSTYYRGTRVAAKAAGVAAGELRRLMPEYLGLTMSQLALGYPVQPEVVTTGWLTFLGPAVTKKLGPTFAKSIAPATVIDLGGGRWAVRSSRAPALGARGDLGALGSLPTVTRELTRRLPAPKPDEYRFVSFALPRQESLARLVP